MRSMFSVVTPRIWVSPRSNSAEPCTRGSTSTSADSVRMSVRPRPSMRTLSRSTRWRTSFLVSERSAPPISFSRPSNWSATSLDGQVLDPVDLGLALLLRRDRERCGQLLGDSGLDGLEDVVLVLEEDRELPGRLRGRVGELLLGLAEQRE